MMFGVGPVELLIVLFLLFAYVVPTWGAWHVAKKAGFSPMWGLAFAVPLVNLAVLWLFAFVDWPALASRGDRAA